MADDLRSKYEQLVRERDEKKQKVLEAKANEAALAERQKEIEAEILALGVDPTKLEAVLAEEERVINEGLVKIKTALDNIDKPQPAITTTPQPVPAKVQDLDEVLARGGQ